MLSYTQLKNRLNRRSREIAELKTALVELEKVIIKGGRDLEKEQIRLRANVK